MVQFRLESWGSADAVEETVGERNWTVGPAEVAVATTLA